MKELTISSQRLGFIVGAGAARGDGEVNANNIYLDVIGGGQKPKTSMKRDQK